MGEVGAGIKNKLNDFSDHDGVNFVKDNVVYTFDQVFLF